MSQVTGLSRNKIELSCGTVEYTDTGGQGPAGPVLVLLHGLLMDASLWEEVAAALSPGCRCVAPTLPLGAHRIPVRDGADLSLPGMARLVTELCDRLGLTEVTLVGNDTGGAIVQLIMADPALSGRAGRAVLASCDAFGNFPPGLTGKALVTAGRLPAGAFGLFMQQMRWRPARRMPIAFGWLTKRGDAATARWLRPVLTQAAIRQDTVRMLRSMRAAAGGGLMAVTAERLPGFTRPALVVWASEDRVMPLEHGKRLVGLLPDGRLAEVADSYTLMPLDQPGRFASLLSEFARPLGPVVVERARGGHQ